ncbi:MAG: hypothetical protein IKO49_04670 [Bacilli bacterium]|nr:hypothetical protein [Bacilli bacterium]
MKKKDIITIIIFLFFIFLIFIGYRLYKNYQVKNAVKIVELNSKEVEVYSDITLKDIIKRINGKLITNPKIDTTKLGKKKIEFEYMTDKNIKVPYTAEITVVDKTPPLIPNIKKKTIYKGDGTFSKNLFCGDNYDDKPKCSIEGDYDINTPGEYQLTYKAEDSSSNVSESNFTLSVIEPPKEDEKDKTDFFDVNAFDYIVSKYKTTNNKIGIDVSSFQGNIDFEKVKNAGVEFVYIRVGRGGGINKNPVIDSKFETNIKGFNKVGIPVGIYFYSYAVNKESAIKDAKWVIKKIKKHKVDLEVAYDFEDWKDFKEYNMSFYHLSEVANKFNETIEKAGYRPMLYSSKYYLENVWFKSKYPVWLSHYTNKTDYQGKFKVWQMCENGMVNGIYDSLVDINIMYD